MKHLTLLCAGRNCCTLEKLFCPKPGEVVDTQCGPLGIYSQTKAHYLRLQYGNQPRKVEWYLAGELNGKKVEVTLVCSRVVRAKPPTHARMGEAVSQPIRTEEDD